jgi:hypothetical protein
MWSAFVDICGVLGLIVSIAGLIMTLKTLREAKGAKVAAERASEQAWRKNAATDFIEMSQRARDLLGHVQNRQSDLATTRATDLLHAFHIALGRWTDVLSAESIARLTLLRTQLEAISRSLSAERIPTDIATFKKLSDRCHTLLSVLSEEAGKVQLNAETDNNE